MKTLEEIKDQVAFDYGYNSFYDLIEYAQVSEMLHEEDYYDEVAKRYARQCCEDLRERIAGEAKMTITNIKGEILTESQAEWDDYDGYRCRVSKISIRSVEIITP